jgi:hypothetical protein
MVYDIKDERRYTYDVQRGVAHVYQKNRLVLTFYL